jgi:hypothetical protein
MRARAVQPRVNLSRTTDRRRAVALAVLACLSIGSAVGLAGGLVSCSPVDEPAEARALTTAEAQRLASMRLVNYRDERAGIEAKYGSGAAAVRMTGWVDWTRSLVYVNVGGPGAKENRGLIQATPGILAARPDPEPAPAEDKAVPAPPVAPPADGWLVRPFTAGGTAPAPLESFLALLLTLANDRTDAADLLQRSESRWLGTDNLAGTAVDVLLGPAVPPQRKAAPTGSPTVRIDGMTPSARGAPAPTANNGATDDGATDQAADQTTTTADRSDTTTPKPQADATPAPATPTPTPVPSALAQMGGGVRYWIDAASRMHRFEALLGPDVPVEVDVDHVDNPVFVAIDAFGGKAIEPRKVTAAEANLLAGVALRNRNRGGGTLELSVPTAPTANLRGAGWIDWTDGVAYLTVRDLDKPADVALMRADGQGVAVLPTKPRDRARPPLPAPTGGNWKYQRWVSRVDASGGLDLDLILAEALTLASSGEEDATILRQRASWLRADTIGGRAVTVFEIAKPQEQGAIRRGQARMRYWIDRSGGLRRIELRTRTGAFAQLDVTPGEVPDLPDPRP